MKKDLKVMITGLDAATCTLVRPWMAEGSTKVEEPLQALGYLE